MENTKASINKMNGQLAALLGWTNIYDQGDSLIGTPPPGHPECRGQALVPKWLGDWQALGPLMVEHDCQVTKEEIHQVLGKHDDAWNFNQSFIAQLIIVGKILVKLTLKEEYRAAGISPV